MNGAYGGVSHTNKNKQFTSLNYKNEPLVTQYLECLPVQDVLDKHGTRHVDYLSLDVEGHELQVLEGFDWNKTRIDVISVEKNRDEGVEKFLKALKFREIFPKGLPGDEDVRYSYDSIYVRSGVSFGAPT